MVRRIKRSGITYFWIVTKMDLASAWPQISPVWCIL
jgi:hypothetical protein